MSTDDAPNETVAPSLIVIMGVSGSGKTTIGALLAGRRCIGSLRMPEALLQSQFDTLEEPGPDEKPIVVSIEAQPRDIVANIAAALHLQGEVP